MLKQIRQNSLTSLCYSAALRGWAVVIESMVDFNDFIPSPLQGEGISLELIEGLECNKLFKRVQIGDFDLLTTQFDPALVGKSL